MGEKAVERVKPINRGEAHCARGNQFPCGDGTERRD